MFHRGSGPFHDWVTPDLEFVHKRYRSPTINCLGENDMIDKLERLAEEFSLKQFYSIALTKIEETSRVDRVEAFLKLAPFIRLFFTKFVNYHQLESRPAIENNAYPNRLDEFYRELCETVLIDGVDSTLPWLLRQKIDSDRWFFPSHPVADSFQDIMRGAVVLNELIPLLSFDGGGMYQMILEWTTAILNPTIDSDFEEMGRELLDEMMAFNARTKGTESAEFNSIRDRLNRVTERINSHLMTNNTFISLTQQITEINKALKTVKQVDFSPLFPEESAMSAFWSGLREFGYGGGENYLYGDFDQNRERIEEWLGREFPDLKTELLATLKKQQHTAGLPVLEKSATPEAVHIYALNILGSAGLRSDAAIRLVLGHHSRFVDVMVRNAALSTLRKNSDAVQRYFFEGLRKEGDFEKKRLIAEKHDTIFETVQARQLVIVFGASSKGVLEELDSIVGLGGFLLSDFIKSAYMKVPGHQSEATDVSEERLRHIGATNSALSDFKGYVEGVSTGAFTRLMNMWGLSYLVSWSLTDYAKESRLFSFIIQAADGYTHFVKPTLDHVLPLDNVISLLTREPDAKRLIQQLMTVLLNSKISFDFPLFRSLFRVVAQRKQQLAGGVRIRDGFSEQRGYAGQEEKTVSDVSLQEPHIFQPIVVFLITVLNMKSINIPKDAFVETDISLYLNSLAKMSSPKKIGYHIYLAYKLISSIPYVIDFASHHETLIRKTIADLDESYGRGNTLIHYHRIKIHRAPSRLDLDFCLEILEGLSAKPLDGVLENLVRMMKGVGDEAIPDLTQYFDLYAEKLKTLGHRLSDFKALYPETPWYEIADDDGFSRRVRDLPHIDDESIKDIIALVKLVNALSNYWTRRINQGFLSSLFMEQELESFQRAKVTQKLEMIRTKRREYLNAIFTYDPEMEPYQHIFLKRHVIQDDWNFDFFGFWPYYKETKFERFNIDRKLALFERTLLEDLEESLSSEPVVADSISDDLLRRVRESVDCLIRIMTHTVDEGLAPSRFFLDTIEVLEKDQLTLSQLNDIVGILLYRELAHIDSFIADTYGHFPERVTRALGRENLDFDLEKLCLADDELLCPLVQETVLGNIMAEARPIHLLEKHLNKMASLVSALSTLDPSRTIYPSNERPPRALTPTLVGYKSYALTTLTQDGFNVPSFVTLPVDFFLENSHLLKRGQRNEFKNELIHRLLSLEKSTRKRFQFNNQYLSDDQWNTIQTARQTFPFDVEEAPRLLISVRSGSYRSMPGILGTVLNVGWGNLLNQRPSGALPRGELNSYRVFLSTFGNVVLGINEIKFSSIISEAKSQAGNGREKKVKWENLSTDQIVDIITQFRQLIEGESARSPSGEAIDFQWDDPLDLLATSVIGVWESWNSESAIQLREFLNISSDWKTPVTLMEMKQADKNQNSFSAILFSGDPQGKTNRPHGDLLFGRSGVDIAAGLASEGTALESIEESHPELYRQITQLLEEIKINKGNINVDVEMVGEYSEASQTTELFVLQERQMPLGTRCESEDYRLTPTDIKPEAKGKGVNGGVQRGVFLDGIHQDYYQLKETVERTRKALGPKDNHHGPGIFLLMEYVTPEEALKMNIPGVDGIITTKIGKSSHASISAKRDGKLFVCEAEITTRHNQWFINHHPIRLGNEKTPDIFTVVGNPKSVSPYSGNIYKGEIPLTPTKKIGVTS